MCYSRSTLYHTVINTNIFLYACSVWLLYCRNTFFFKYFYTPVKVRSNAWKRFMHNNELANWDWSNSIDWSFFLFPLLFWVHETVCVCVCVCVQKQKQNPDTKLPPADQPSYTSSVNTLKVTEYQEVRRQFNASLMAAVSCIGQCHMSPEQERALGLDYSSQHSKSFYNYLKFTDFLNLEVLPFLYKS